MSNDFCGLMWRTKQAEKKTAQITVNCFCVILSCRENSMTKHKSVKSKEEKKRSYTHWWMKANYFVCYRFLMVWMHWNSWTILYHENTLVCATFPQIYSWNAVIEINLIDVDHKANAEKLCQIPALDASMSMINIRAYCTIIK